MRVLIFHKIIHVTSYMRIVFLPTVGPLSLKYSLQEATPKLGMGFLH